MEYEGPFRPGVPDSSHTVESLTARALWYVLHADLPAAARHHFLFVFSLPFLAWLFASWAGNRAFGWRLPELRISPKVIGGFLALWFAFSVARNLPWAPFTSLYV
ncbi:hypothetical protein GCM10027452_19630 [Micromonospora halotolerans]